MHCNWTQESGHYSYQTPNKTRCITLHACAKQDKSDRLCTSVGLAVTENFQIAAKQDTLL